MKLWMAAVATLAAIAVVFVATTMPRSADAQSTQSLANGEIFVSTTDVPDASFPRVRVIGVVDAPPALVWGMVKDCTGSKNTMPNVSKSYIVRREGDDVVCSETIALPFPLKDLVSVTKWHFTRKGNSYVREWTLVEGDFDYANGSIKVTPFGEAGTRSLVEYRNHFAPQLSVPNWLSSYFQKRGLPSIIEHIREASARKSD